MTIREDLAAAHVHYSNINAHGFEPDLATLLLRAIEENAALEGRAEAAERPTPEPKEAGL